MALIGSAARCALAAVCVALAFSVFAVARPTVDAALRGNRILLVLPQESAYASLIGDLKAEGFYLTIKTSRTREFPLFEFGAPLYDGVFFVDYLGEQGGNGVDAHELLRFINAGGNVVITGTSEGSNVLREVALQSGFEMDARTSFVIDHFHAGPTSKADHSLIETTEVLASRAIFPEPITKPILYQSPGHVVTGTNPLAFSLLRAASTAYTTKGTGATGVPFALGKSISLVSALQARNNARLVIAGSVGMFTDIFVHGKTSAKYSGNREFSRNVLKWAFQRTGVLRITNADHHRVNQTRAEYYRIKDDMVYSVRIEELRDDKWLPFKADDVQMEATMLDPYLRVPFTHDGKGNFAARFQLPDVHGMYTLHLQYSRKGYAHLETADIISVRPFRHNEFERFIPAAYPYYASSFSMMAAVILFSLVFLYYREPVAPATPKKTQ